MNIFVSSVKAGLEEERMAVIRQIQKLGGSAIGMEYFTAHSEPPPGRSELRTT